MINRSYSEKEKCADVLPYFPWTILKYIETKKTYSYERASIQSCKKVFKTWNWTCKNPLKVLKLKFIWKYWESINIFLWFKRNPWDARKIHDLEKGFSIILLYKHNIINRNSTICQNDNMAWIKTGAKPLIKLHKISKILKQNF